MIKNLFRFSIMLRLSVLLPAIFYFSFIGAQPVSEKTAFTRQDTLRGSITPERAWWDVEQYKLFVKPDFANRTLKGEITIVYKTLKGGQDKLMQIDLQQPMDINRVVSYSPRSGTPPKLNLLTYKRDGNVYYIENAPHNPIDSVTIYFSGSPRIAVNPPWDGGWIFVNDAKNRPWMTVACQGLGASVWYPCKDYQGDEPDNGAIISVNAPNDLVAVANGKLIQRKKDGNNITWTWQVKNPINNYNIVPYIGKYVHWADSFHSESGKTLSLDYWVMDYNLGKSKSQFSRDVKPMLRSFEYWFGPYPFIEDGFKLVETPHLGMEHQSAIAYGNRYTNGYLGTDLSGSGWGTTWDYIIVHESGHEWFANNITTNDIADMWVHEGFTMYSEVLFVESQYGKKAANEYCIGLRNHIGNESPLIGPYGVNQEGSGDMYNKGANFIHTIRQLFSDSTFREMLRGLNKDFRHQTVDSKDIEQYISKKAGRDLSHVFDQYLRTTKIPVLEYRMTPGKDAGSYVLHYRWTNTVAGFDLPVRIYNGNRETWIKPGSEFRELVVESAMPELLNTDPNMYIQTRKID